MPTLLVTGTQDFSSNLFSPRIDAVEFHHRSASTAIATFAASQFDGTHINTVLMVTGSVGIDRFVVNDARVFDASQWSFVTWSAADLVTFNGSGLDDAIIGSLEADAIFGGQGNDTLTGGLGADTLAGGLGDDTFRITTAADITGDVLSGDDGTGDRIQITAAGTFALSAATLSGVEILEFTQAAQATLSAGQIGGALGQIHTVIGSAGVNTVAVSGGLIDLSGVAFQNWSVTDNVLLTGTTLNDHLTGSRQSDTIETGASGGADTLLGGAGDDRFRLLGNFQGVHINGGAGTADRLQVLVASHDFSLDVLTKVEILEFSVAPPQSLTLHGDQIGGASGLNTVLAGTTQADLTVAGQTVDLSNVAFQLWKTGFTITIDGTTLADRLTGSAQEDSIFGSSGADNLNGGAGDDSLNGGSENDALVGGLGRDILTGGGQSDRFIFTDIAQSAPGAADEIEDFSNGVDRIVLKAIDADSTTATTNEAFKFIGTGAFTSHARELHYVLLGGKTVIEADVNGDAVADLVIELVGTHVMTAGDFLA